MKKYAFALALALLLPFVFSLSASAFDDPSTESMAEDIGVDGIQNEYLSKDELSGEKSINVFQKAIEIISAELSEKGISVVRSFGAILSVVLLVAVMNAMKNGESEALDNACGYISVLALSGVTYSVFYKVFVVVIAAMESLTVAVSGLMPVMASAQVLGGSVAAGAASSASLTLFLSVITVICSKILMPLLQISFALCVVGAIPGSVNLRAVTNLVKSTATTLMAFVFTLLGFTLYLQTAVASASDSYITRSVKFASGVFVPVIGGMLGDAARTVFASVSIIKGTVGAAGVVIVLSVILPPLVTVVLNKLMLLCCGIVAKSLSCERESAFLYDLGGITGVLLALVAGAGAVCLIALAVFVRSGVIL